VTGKRRGDGDTPPFIVRKLRARRHAAPHGSWKVAYSDFMTSLLALFIVLWAAEQSPEVRSSIASYFRNPSVVPGRPEASLMPAGTGVVALASAAAPPAEADERALQETAARIRTALEADPSLRELRDQVRIEMTPEGLRIQLVEREDHLFFEIGSADVKPAMVRLLGLVAAIVGRLPNEVAVEGHTDIRQYARQGRAYSNWELSADRANSARRVLEASGLRERQIVRVVGFADHELLVADDPLNAQNRRVSVIVRHARMAQPPAPGSAPLPRLARRAAERTP
jgi:chemotaxis protein MotB